MIKNEVKKVDEDLYRFMVPQCIYRCGLCQEWESCGYVKTDKFRKELKSYLTGFENNCMNDLLNNVLNS
jgi:predicted metalloprotease